MNMRAIDISTLDAIALPDPGPLPVMEWLDVDSLRIDGRYQRDLGAKNWRSITRIAKGFDWVKFTPVTVAWAEAADQWTLIDGQHRAHAAALAGIKKIPAIIVDIPLERQASVFAAINTERTTVTALGIYKAALVSGEDWAIRSRDAVHAGGCTLMSYNKSSKTKKPREIFIVGMIREHIKVGRDATVTRALAAITGSSRSDDLSLYQLYILRPWMAVLAGRQRLLSLDLERFISTVDLVNLITDIPAGEVSKHASLYQARLAAIERALINFEASGLRATPVARNAVHQRPEKPVEAPAAPPMCIGDWTQERDTELSQCGGSYRSLVALAEKWGKPVRAVTARWHKVRVST